MGQLKRLRAVCCNPRHLQLRGRGDGRDQPLPPSLPNVP